MKKYAKKVRKWEKSHYWVPLHLGKLTQSRLPPNYTEQSVEHHMAYTQTWSSDPH